MKRRGFLSLGIVTGLCSVLGIRLTKLFAIGPPLTRSKTHISETMGVLAAFKNQEYVHRFPEGQSFKESEPLYPYELISTSWKRNFNREKPFNDNGEIDFHWEVTSHYRLIQEPHPYGRMYGKTYD